jgi:hypothetical protein
MNKTVKTLLVTTLVTGSLVAGYLTVPMMHAEQIKTNNAAANEEEQQIVKKIMELSAKGKTINSEEFGIGSHESDIRKKWGEPTGSNETYLSYMEKKQTEFALKDGIVTNWVNSSDKRIKEITYDEVVKIAGEPNSNKISEEERYVTYQTGKYTLLLIFDGHKKTDKVKWMFVRSLK